MPSDEARTPTVEGTAGARTQLVVIALDPEEFALSVDAVSEVVRMAALAAVPEGPPWLAGMLNLRGGVVPVVDLRTRLGLPQRPPDLDSRIVIAAVQGRAVGALVDHASEVLTLPTEALEEPDEAVGTAHALAAVARDGDRLIPVLDPVRLFAGAVAVAPQGESDVP